MGPFASAAALLAAMFLAGCASIPEVPLGPAAGEAFRGREITLAVRDRPDFVAFTSSSGRCMELPADRVEAEREHQAA
jgi:hypothetical protein